MWVSFSHNTQHKTEPPKFPRLQYSWAAWSRDRGYSRCGVLAVRFCSYTVRRMQYDRPSQRQLLLLFNYSFQFFQSGCTRLVMAPQPPSAKNGTLHVGRHGTWTFPANEIGVTGLRRPSVLMMMMMMMTSVYRWLSRPSNHGTGRVNAVKGNQEFTTKFCCAPAICIIPSRIVNAPLCIIYVP